MGVRAKVAAIEILDDEVRLALVQTGGRLPKILELHRCSIARPGQEALEPAWPDSENPVPVQDAPEDLEGQRREDLGKALRTVVSSLRARPAAYVLCASSEHCISRSLTVPFKGARRVAAAVPFELEPYLAFPIEELVVDYLHVQEVEGQTEVLILGMRRDHLADSLALLEEAGVDPQGIGLDGIGLTALWVAKRRPKGLYAVLHVGERGSAFGVMNGKALHHFRYVNLKAADAAANPRLLARHAGNAIRAYRAAAKNAGEFTCLSITGLSLSSDVCEQFEAELGLPVVPEDLMQGIKGASQALAELAEEEGADSAETASNRWTPAIGVALAAAGGSLSFNFRRGDLAWRQATRSVSGHVVFSCGLALLVLLGVAWYFHAEAREIEGQAELLRQRIETVEAESEEMRASNVNVPIDLFVTPPLLDVLGVIADKMPDDKVRITEMKMDRPGSATRGWITIRGESSNKALFDEVMADLATSNLFKVNPDADFRMEGGKSTFTITLLRPETESEDESVDDAASGEEKNPKTGSESSK